MGVSIGNATTMPMGAPISGVNGPQYGMPISGTPIGLAGPPHIPFGSPAGLQKHVIVNHTKVHVPEPTPQSADRRETKAGHELSRTGASRADRRDEPAWNRATIVNRWAIATNATANAARPKNLQRLARRKRPSKRSIANWQLQNANCKLNEAIELVPAISTWEQV